MHFLLRRFRCLFVDCRPSCYRRAWIETDGEDHAADETRVARLVIGGRGLKHLIDQICAIHKRRRPSCYRRAWIETPRARSLGAWRCVARLVIGGRGLKRYGYGQLPTEELVARLVIGGRGLKRQIGVTFLLLLVVARLVIGGRGLKLCSRMRCAGAGSSPVLLSAGVD